MTQPDSTPAPDTDPPLPRSCMAPVSHPWLALLGLAIVTAGLGAGIARVEFDASTERVFPEGHPAVVTYSDFRDAFGGDESIVVVFELPGQDAFSPEALSLGRDLDRALEDTDGIYDAASLIEVPVIKLHPLTGFPVMQPGLPEDLSELTPERLAEWREDVLRTPFVDPVLISKDRDASAVMAFLDPTPAGPDGADEAIRLVERVNEIVAEAQARHPGATFHLGGSPMVKAAIVATVQRDLAVFTGPLLLLVMVVAYVLLRSARAVALVMATILTSLAIVLGTMGWVGVPVDPMTSLVPTLILVIGVADCLHLLVELRAQSQRTSDVREATRRALGHVFLPCLLTSVTTAIGFGSLLASDIMPIRRFGGAAALAALAAFAVTMILVPACTVLVGARRERDGQAPDSGTPLRLDRLANWVTARPIPSLILGTGFTVVCAVGFLRVVPDTNFLAFFPEDSQLVQDAMVVQDRFVGASPCEILIETEPDAWRQPEVLQALWDFERELEAGSDLVDMCVSPADGVAAAVQLQTGEPSIPDDPEVIARMERVVVAMSNGELPMEKVISPPSELHPDHDWIRVSVRAKVAGSRRYEEMIELVHELEAKHLTPLGLSAEPTGTSVVFSKTADRIMQGQIESFAMAFVVITMVMILALRSLWLGLLSILPNLVPIAAIMGAMGFLEIHLSSFNSMVCSVAIGIAVDDTIHVLTGYQRLWQRLPRAAAVKETIAHEGAAVIATSVVLLSGFSVLLLADFRPTFDFGLLTGIAIGAALLGDFILLPALLLLAGKLRGEGPAGDRLAPSAAGGEGEAQASP
jgi:uncharacterized protein